MSRAYRVPVFGGGPGSTDGLRSRVARGRPNWWVILAVSLGLMALLVATAGGSPSAPRRVGGANEAAARVSPGASPGAGNGTGAHHGGSAGAGAATRPTTFVTTTTTTTTVPPSSSGSADVAATHLTTGNSSRASSTPPAAAPIVTTTTVAPPTTTTTAATPAVPADRMQTEGYLNPPLETSNKYVFTGTGAMQISVVWSGSTYLTLQVTCPSGDQSGGGTAAMAASLPDASGNCLATVTEPSSEATSLTYTISIGPAGG